MNAVDFRGTPLQVGDIVAASMGGRYHELQERVVYKLNPKTVGMVKLDAVIAFEKERGMIVTEPHQLIEVVNSEHAGWYHVGHRQFRMVAKVGSLEEREQQMLSAGYRP